MIFKSKQVLAATLIVALGAAVAVNWYYTNTPSTDEQVTTQAVSGNLGDSLYVGGTTAASSTSPTEVDKASSESKDYFAWKKEIKEKLVELLAKSCGVSMSSYFRYRDILDIVKEKKNVMEFSENDSEILGYIIKSLELNHVIAPKIKAIYALLNGDACVGDE